MIRIFSFITIVLLLSGCLSLASSETFSSVSSKRIHYITTGFDGKENDPLSNDIISTILDEQDRYLITRSNPQLIERMNRGEPLTINDIIHLHQHGIEDKAILNYIYSTRSQYLLSDSQISRLKNAGISRKFIITLIKTGNS